MLIGESAQTSSQPRGLTWRRVGLALATPFRQAFALVLMGLWQLLPTVRRRLPVSFAFVVYGTVADRRAYFPAWSERFLPAAFPIGLMRFEERWGIIAGTSYDVAQLQADPMRSLAIVQEIGGSFPDKIGAVALAGQIPSWLYQAGYDLKWPVVQGVRGTRYAVFSAAKRLAEEAKVSPGELVIGVPGGAGHIGKQVVTDLARVFQRVIAYDTRYADATKLPTSLPPNVICTANPDVLSQADVLIILTPKGDDILPIIRFLRPGIIVADDTHPCLKKQGRALLRERRVRYLKATMENLKRPFVFLQRLPNFGNSDVPGCLLEALVFLHCLECQREYFGLSPEFSTDEDWERQQAFNLRADVLGFVPKLAEHTGDS